MKNIIHLYLWRNTALYFVLIFTMFSCATRYIPNTEILANDDTEAIFSLIGTYQAALEEKSIEKIQSLLSLNYYDDFGTRENSDDLDYFALQKRLESDFESMKKISLDLKILQIQVDKDRAYSDLHFFYRVLVQLTDKEMWKSHDDHSRLHFIREENHWKIIAGL